MKNKKAQLGEIFGMFWATIAIIVVLVIFIIGAAVVKTFDAAEKNVRIYEEKETGIYEIITEYPAQLIELQKIKMHISRGNKFGEAYTGGIK